MTAYRFGAINKRTDQHGFDGVLANAYRDKLRPYCLCSDPPVEMYVCQFSGRHLIKRMPGTGADHSPGCDSYEPPPELSGLGQVMGTAIQEDPEAGRIALKLGFSLTKIGGRAAPVAGESTGTSVKADTSKLSLHGMLDYLWDQAGFNRWAPAMAGRRGWFVVRKFLLQAAAGKTSKGGELADSLYIPEAFSPERKDEITQRRVAQFAKASAPVGGKRHLMIMIGDVKEIAPSRFGHKIIFKHLPDAHFMLAEDLHKRLVKRFEAELGLWEAVEDSHLVAIATFSVGLTGIASIEEVALQVVTANWIPIADTFEKMVIDAMTNDQRRFVKGLRYNLPKDRPLACLVASDTAPGPTAMYVLPPGVSDEHVAALNQLVDESHLSHWIWRAGEAMPSLPELGIAAASHRRPRSVDQPGGMWADDI